MKFARKSKRARRSIWEPCAQWGRRWLEHLPSVPPGYDLYVKWPGERTPPPPSPGPRWDGQVEDWELAA
jgi:hypothetical protein